MAGVLQLTLERDGHDQPWGFRLQGGVDVGVPLSIQRIMVATPADSVLLKGDIITKISSSETKNLSHQQAVDLFTNAGNQITVTIKRMGVQSNLPHKEESPTAVPASTSPSPKTSEPYRTSPLIQPTAKALTEIGPGSLQHLKMQADHIAGVREAHPPPSDVQQSRASEFLMKQKITGTLQQIQQSQSGSAPNTPEPVVRIPSPTMPIQPVPSQHSVSPQPTNISHPKQKYNSPINLYSAENVADVAKNPPSFKDQQPMDASPSPTRLVNPQTKPYQVVLNPPKDFNPKDSATWRALQEMDAPVDPEKVRSYSSLREHDPVYSEIYTAPKNIHERDSNSTPPYHRPGNNPKSPSSPLPTFSKRSPVSDLLPKSKHMPMEVDPPYHEEVNSDDAPSAVRIAALRESKPYDPQLDVRNNARIPMYEVTPSGSRRRIPQCATFNKVMMDVLGE